MSEDLSLLAHLKLTVLRHKFIILTLSAMIAGGVLMLIHPYLPAKEFIRDLGSAVFTAGTIGLTVEFYTRQEFTSLAEHKLAEVIARSSLAARVEALHELVPLSNAITQQGLKKIHPKRQAIDFRSVIEEAHPGEVIRLLGVCMRDFSTPGMQRRLRRKLEEGCTIRLLILDPASEFAGHHTSGDNLDESQATRRQIKSTDDLHGDFIEGLSDTLRGRIEFGHYDSPPHVLLVGTSHTVIVSFYLREARGELFPHLELRNKPDAICQPFIRHFDSLWESRVEAQDASGEAQAAD